MRITETLEKDKDRLLTEIGAAGSAEKAIAILEKETDKLLLSHNERAGSDAERVAAAHMMQVVRLSLPFIDSNGTSKVFEKASGGSGKASRLSIASIILLVGGIGLLIYGLFPLVTLAINNSGDSANTQLLSMIGAIVMGGAALYLAGSTQGKPNTGKKKEYHIEQRVDADRIYRNYRTIMLSVDQAIEEIKLGEKQAKREQAGNIDGRAATTPEIELFSDLLAASYSGDPEFALEKIAGIKYYLHQQQIEVVDFSEDTSQYFDLMPGTTGGTIRPALVVDGALLKKGLASKGN